MKGLSRRDRRRSTALKRKEKDAEREQARSAGSKAGNRTETPAIVDGGSCVHVGGIEGGLPDSKKLITLGYAL
jgi:hypothetical protein